jgi:ribosomal protein S18 acetylase RimI-like enzyme
MPVEGLVIAQYLADFVQLIAECKLRIKRHSIYTLAFSPKYRGKVLEGEVAEAAEEIIRETCKELDIEIITYFLKGSIKN